jgi:hypothetical protein
MEGCFISLLCYGPAMITLRIAQYRRIGHEVVAGVISRIPGTPAFPGRAR